MSAETHTRVKPASPPPSATPVAKGLLQRKCACGGSPGAAGECADCQKKRLDLRGKPRSTPEGAQGAPARGHGHDFARVRVFPPAALGKYEGSSVEDLTGNPMSQRPPGSTLPYREATELAECIRIMGEESADYCRETVLGEKPAIRTLSMKTLPGSTTGDCGDYSWPIQWLLSIPSGSKGGYVIQTIDVTYDVKKCGTNCDGAAVDTTKLKFQEAWPINPKQKVTKWAEAGDPYDDTYSDPSYGTDTCGSITVKATTAYFDGITLPADFKVNNPDTQAGILPSTKTIHSFTGGTPAISHDLKAEWKCCPDAEKTKVTR